MTNSKAATFDSLLEPHSLSNNWCITSHLLLIRFRHGAKGSDLGRYMCLLIENFRYKDENRKVTRSACKLLRCFNQPFK